MNDYKKIEIIVGIFVLIGVMSLSWLAIKLGQVGGLGQKGYELTAHFEDAGGVRDGTDVMLAGVIIGQVKTVYLKDNEVAELILIVNHDVKLTTDAIASIRTKGLIGEKFVRITQGMDEDYLADGDTFDDTESSISIEDLISKYIFSGDVK